MGKRKSSPPIQSPAVGTYNLRQLYMKSDQVDRELGHDYFYLFSDRLEDEARRFGCMSRSTACGVYAALSPNNSQESNVEDMIRAIAAWTDHPRTERDTRWKALRVHTYGPNKAKARRILDGESPALVLKGNKTYNFYENLNNPSDPEYVTIDGHMVNIWNGARVPLDHAGITPREYTMIADGVKEVSRCFIDIRPNQLQAILWLTWRRIHRIYYDPQFKLYLTEKESA